MSIFSRSDHIKSLGIYSAQGCLDFDNSLELGSSHSINSSVDLEPNLSERASSPEKDAEGENRTNDKDASSKSWDDFKAEFSSVFQASEEKVASGEVFRATSPVTSPVQSASGSGAQHDLIIEMITSLHDSRERGLAQNHHHRHQSPEAEETTSAVSLQDLCKSSSPTRPRKRLLSLTTLETIREAEIDRLLETVEDSAAFDRLHRGDGSMADRDDTTSPSSSPHPRGAWGMQEGERGSEELMRQLQRLSLRQANGHGGLGEAPTMPPSISPASDKDLRGDIQVEALQALGSSNAHYQDTSESIGWFPRTTCRVIPYARLSFCA